MKQAKLWISFAVLMVLVSGCATRNSLFVETDALVDQRDFASAAAILEDEENADIYPNQDQVLRYLDIGTLYFYAGDYQRSNQYLEEAERLIEENFSKSVTEAAGSLLLNDTVIAYPGEDYEDLYINVMKAINYTQMGDFDGAFVEVRRMNQKLLLLEDKYKDLAGSVSDSPDAKTEVEAGSAQFYKSALGHFLSLLLYRADGQFDNARIDLLGIDEAFTQQPSIYNFPPPDLSNSLLATDAARLSIVGFSGMAPEKQAVTYRLITAEDEITFIREEEDDFGNIVQTDRASLYFPVEGGLFFKCQVPTLVPRPSEVDRVVVRVDGSVIGELQLIENLATIAQDTFSIKEPITLIKTITRTIVKGIAANEATKAAESQGGALLGFLTDLAGTAAVEGSEIADLRAGRYLPGQAWVGDLEVSPGQRNVVLEYLDASGRIVFIDDKGMVDIAPGDQLNMVASSALR